MWEKAEFRNVTLGFEELSALNELSHTFCVQCTVLSSVPLRFQDNVKICNDDWL
jgi:hypothetical protein